LLYRTAFGLSGNSALACLFAGNFSKYKFLPKVSNTGFEFIIEKEYFFERLILGCRPVMGYLGRSERTDLHAPPSLLRVSLLRPPPPGAPA
jgi:hypothetical protein